MKTGGSRSISRIRTFAGDVACARGEKPETQVKIQKQKETAQNIADNLLKQRTPAAKDFLGTEKEVATAIEPATQKMIPPVAAQKEEVPAPKKETPQEKKKQTLKKKNTKKTLTADVEKTLQSSGAQKEAATDLSQKATYDISNNDLGEGTIITNKRRRKHRLFPSMYTAIRSWFHKKKKEITTPKKPEHTISKAESRIETITAAARASKHAPQNDHGVVIKRLTKTKRKKHAPEVLIKKKEEVATPQWGSVQNTKSVEISHTNIPVNLPTQESAKATEIHHELPKKLTKEPTAPQIPQVNEMSEEALPIPPAPVESTSKEPPTPEVPANPAPEKDISPTPPIEKDEDKKRRKQNKKITQQPVPQKKRAYKANPAATSGVPMYVYAIVVVVASTLGITAGMYWFTSSTTVQETTVVHIPSLFVSDSTVPASLQSQTDLLSTITEASFNTRETMLIYPAITNESGVTTAIDTQSIFEALHFKVPGSFTRGVTDISFGSYNGTDPFILMQVKSFDTAFGGLLEWEPDMSSDLSPLFGEPVSQSYDPYARTDTQLRSAFFRDTVIANKSVRVLVNENDTEKLLYAFINPNLVLITTNTETFTAVLPLISQ